MRRTLIILFLLIIPAIAYSQPSIQFGEETHDFGTVAKGETLENTFVFKNIGDEELVIERLGHS